MDDLEYMTTLNCFYFIFISIIIKINHLYLLSISLSHILKAYGHVVILSKVRNILSSLLLSAILSISAGYTQCASLANLCCNFSMTLFLNKQFISLNLSILFITPYVVHLAFLTFLSSSAK